VTPDQKALYDTQQGYYTRICTPFLFSKAVRLFRAMDRATCILYRPSYYLYTLRGETEIDELVAPDKLGRGLTLE